MRRRTRLTLLIVLLVAAILALIVVLRSQAPPEAVRLLPGADAFVYFDLKWVRRLASLSELPPVTHDPAYEQFIQETGFQFERDLDEAAFAVHYTGPLAGPDGMPRFSEVFTGHWNAERVSQYLTKIANSVEKYRDIEVFDIPLQGRTVRVAMLGVGTVAVSNTDDPLVIRGIIDRSRKLASPFGGPSLLRAYYRNVPFGSLAWAVISHPDQLQTDRVGGLLLPGDYRQMLSNSVVVVSVRFLRAIHLRVEGFFPDATKAAQASEKLGAWLAILHTLEPNVSEGAGGDQDVKRFFDSLQADQEKNHVTLSAIMPVGFIRKVIAGPVPEPPTPAPPTAPEAKKPTKHQGRKRKLTH